MPCLEPGRCGRGQADGAQEEEGGREATAAE